MLFAELFAPFEPLNSRRSYPPLPEPLNPRRSCPSLSELLNSRRSCPSLSEPRRLFVRFQRTVLSRRLDNYITFRDICQEVFSKFFNFFRPLFHSLERTFILYHSLRFLSRGFSKIFLIFFRPLFHSFERTLILYHRGQLLSRGFLRFL